MSRHKAYILPKNLTLEEALEILDVDKNGLISYRYEKRGAIKKIENELKHHDALENEYQCLKKSYVALVDLLETLKKYVYVEKDKDGNYWLFLLGGSGIGITKEEYDLLKWRFENDEEN